MTDLIEALRSGAVRLVPGEATLEMCRAAVWALDRAREADGLLQEPRPYTASEKHAIRYRAMLSASPDHTADLLALIEGQEEKLEYWPETSKHWEARALAAEARAKALEAETLHHETGERITRKDLNNAYRAGQENGRLAAELLPALSARSAEPVAWRLLQNGEIIEATDQVLADDTVRWIPLWGWEIGLPYNSGVFVPVRRAALPTPEAA